MKVHQTLEKLLLIDKELGGNQTFDFVKIEEQDEFKDCQKEVEQALEDLGDKVKLKESIYEERGKCADTIRIEVELRSEFQELEQAMRKINDILRRQSKALKKAQYEQKEKGQVYKGLKDQVKALKEYDSRVSSQGASLKKDSVQVKTLTQTKAMDLDAEIASPKKRNYEQLQDEKPNKEEEEFYARVKHNEQLQDEKAAKIQEGAEALRQQALRIGEQQDVVMDKVNKLKKQVEVTNKTIVSQNTKLKSIMRKYRAPGKFCMDICLLLTLIILVGILSKFM